jgi:hypothetical protein
MTTIPSLREVAIRYHQAGWHPVPLPRLAKYPPPNGLTGESGIDLTAPEVATTPWDGNIGLRMPPDVIGLDIDAYGGKPGLVTFREMIGRLGPLPNTRITHSGRNDNSGIRFYRVPVGHWLTKLPGIEIIQRSHRYAMVWPSTHPDGRQYGWWDQAEGGPTEDVPLVEDLPELPWPWIEELSRSERDDGTPGTHPRPASADAVEVFLSEQVTAEAPGYPTTIAAYFAEHHAAGFSRHDTMQHCLIWAMESCRAGLAPARHTVDALAEVWVAAVDPDTRRMELWSTRRVTEWDAMLRHAVGKVNAKTADEVYAIHDKVVGMPVAPGTPAPKIADYQSGPVRSNLPNEFWQTRPCLRDLRIWAHSRGVSADGVYATVRARLCVLQPHTLRVDTGIASPVSLNSLLALIADSGGGKTTAAAEGRTLVPLDLRLDIYEGPIGSGEGVVESYFEWVDDVVNGKTRQVKKQVMTAVLLRLDEGEALSRMAERAGSTIMPTLRSAYSGELIGQSNAGRESRRVLKPHEYRLVVVVSLQEKVAATLLADSLTGTPQRFVMFNANDPAIPDNPMAANLPWKGLTVLPTIQGTAHLMTVADSVKAEIRTRYLDAKRGKEREPLDSHRDQNRIKEAAMLALLDGARTHIDEEDWRLAGMVLDTSDAIRRRVLDAKVRGDELAIVQRGAAQGHREAVAETVRERRLISELADRIVLRVPDEGVGANVLERQLTAKRTRHRFKPALEYAVSEGKLAVRDGRIIPCPK